MPQENKDWKKEFDKKFTYGVLLSASSDLKSPVAADSSVTCR